MRFPFYLGVGMVAGSWLPVAFLGHPDKALVGTVLGLLCLLVGVLRTIFES